MREAANLDVMPEMALLKTFTLQVNFNLYEHCVNYKRVFPQTKLLLEDYKKYYEMYPKHEEIDMSLFYTQFSQNWHIDFDDQQMDYYKNYVFPCLNAIEIEEVESCLLGLVKKQTSQEIRDILISEFNSNKIKDLLEQYELKESEILKIIDTEIHTIDKVDFSILDKANGIPWFLPALQNGLGSLVKGQLVVVTADYGTGKSAFVISQAAEALSYITKNKIDRPILYFNSEGTEADVFGRLCSNLYRDNIYGGFEEILQNSEIVRKDFIETYGVNSFYVIQMTNSTIGWIKNKIQKYNPALVIVDITDTLAPEESPQMLKKVYDKLRLLSGAYCPIIATTQSGNTQFQDKETGELKTRKWLTDKDLYGSKIGKGGAADTIIAIGKDDKNPKLRYISTPKKKRGIPVNLSCEIEEIYSLYRELAW